MPYAVLGWQSSRTMGFPDQRTKQEQCLGFLKKMKHQSFKPGTEATKKLCFVNTFCTQAYFYIKTKEYMHLYRQRTIYTVTNTHTLRTKCFLCIHPTQNGVSNSNQPQGCNQNTSISPKGLGWEMGHNNGKQRNSKATWRRAFGNQTQQMNLALPSSAAVGCTDP